MTLDIISLQRWAPKIWFELVLYGGWRLLRVHNVIGNHRNYSHHNQFRFASEFWIECERENENVRRVVDPNKSFFQLYWDLALLFSGLCELFVLLPTLCMEYCWKWLRAIDSVDCRFHCWQQTITNVFVGAAGWGWCDTGSLNTNHRTQWMVKYLYSAHLPSIDEIHGVLIWIHLMLALYGEFYRYNTNITWYPSIL